jgi:predicted nucleic acid-binding protein
VASGLLDTSVVIDLDDPTVLSALPEHVAVCAITIAELAAGPHLASTKTEAARRQTRLQQIESSFDPLPFDTRAARSYGQVVAAITVVGRSHRRRIADLMIAATAHAHDLPLYTRNPDDFTGLDGLVVVVAV